jgi:UDP-N-acetylmuramyl pentapeptide phosphotransferase/UDP-N-acetylglucosamine-1-phosphate transferase
MTFMALCLGTFLCSCLFTMGIRAYVSRKGFLDVPNKRSSHRRPVAGGGIAIGVSLPTGLGASVKQVDDKLRRTAQWSRELHAAS